HDWYYGNKQDTTGSALTAESDGNTYQTGNYPQGLVGGMYWITPATVPTTLNVRGIPSVQGTSSSSSTIQDLIKFAESPAEQAAFDNAGDLQINEITQT